jgi:hypothetical protein
VRVVIGAGTDGLRAAAALAASGEAVLLLQATDTPHGLIHPDLPEGTGRMAVTSAQRDAVEAVTGPLVDAPSVRRAVVHNGQTTPLPMSAADAVRLFESGQRAHVGRKFAECRIRNALIPLTGEGQEERTYRQWVERRMGAPAYHHVYADYARSRWGLPGESLSVVVARVHHNPHGDGHATVVGGGPAAGIAAALDVITANGGEVRCGVNVRGLKVVDGRVSAVRVGRRHISVSGDLWIARSHGVVAAWLGDAISAAERVDASALTVMDRVQIAFEGDTPLAADELHMLDAGWPAWRVSQVYSAGLTVVFHMNVLPGEEAPDPGRLVAQAEASGIRGLTAASARIERLPAWVPVWAPLVHARLRRVGLAFSRLGVVSVGRRGTFAPLDAGTELVLATRYAAEAQPDQREALRALVDPPVKDDDLNASFRDFLWR